MFFFWKSPFIWNEQTFPLNVSLFHRHGNIFIIYLSKSWGKYIV